MPMGASNDKPYICVDVHGAGNLYKQNHKKGIAANHPNAIRFLLAIFLTLCLCADTAEEAYALKSIVHEITAQVGETVP